MDLGVSVAVVMRAVFTVLVVRAVHSGYIRGLRCKACNLREVEIIQYPKKPKAARGTARALLA